MSSKPDSRLGGLQAYMTQAQARSVIAELDVARARPARMVFNRASKDVRIEWSAMGGQVTRVDQAGMVFGGSSA